jgi:hypothetical protein
MDKDIMKPSIIDVTQNPLKKEDMIKPSMDIDNEFDQEEEKTIYRRR